MWQETRIFGITFLRAYQRANVRLKYVNWCCIISIIILMKYVDKGRYAHNIYSISRNIYMHM
jgi:hypothetical protein